MKDLLLACLLLPLQYKLGKAEGITTDLPEWQEPWYTAQFSAII